MWSANPNLGTGPNGMIWLPGIQMPSSSPATVKVTLTAPTGAKETADVVVEDQAITFVTRQL
jgi:hypothetical protein